MDMLTPTGTTALTPANVGFHLQTSEVKDLTIDVLHQFRAINSSSVEREITTSRVKHLREKADAGRLVTFHWVTAEHAGQTLRMNGQHSSEMLKGMEADNKFPANLKVHREHYLVDDGDALALLFQQFDDRRSSRSIADVAAVYQGLQPDLASIDKKIAKLSIDGYVWFRRRVEGIMGTPVGDMAYTLFRDTGLHPFIHWLASIQNSKSKELKLDPVVAAIFGTFERNESAARAFWEQVAHSYDPDDQNPAAILDRWLLSILDKHYEDERPSPQDIYQGCIYAWNASREDKKIPAIKWERRKGMFAAIRE
jgi:hypothetical protein